MDYLQCVFLYNSLHQYKAALAVLLTWACKNTVATRLHRPLQAVKGLSVVTTTTGNW